MDRVLALHEGSRGFDSHRVHLSERFFRSSRPGYPHPVNSELENSGIRVAGGDCSVTERRRWRPPYQTGKIVHVHPKHYKHNEDGRTAPGVCGNGSVPLSHSGNVVTRIEIHTDYRYLKSKHGCPNMRLNILLCAFLFFFYSFLSSFCKYMGKVKVKIWVLRPFQEYFAYIEPIINQGWAKTGVPIVLS